MPDMKPQGLNRGVRSSTIFASAASDPPIAGTSRRLQIAAIALAFAAAIWLFVATEGLGPGAPIDLLIMAIVGAGLDAVVAFQLWQQRWSRVILAYVVVRTVLAAGGFVLICLPAYIVALLATPTRWPPDPILNSTVPHAFRPASGGLFADVLPWWGPRAVSADGTLMCQCGKQERDEVHVSPG